MSNNQREEFCCSVFARTKKHLLSLREKNAEDNYQAKLEIN
jgi:hypothetical protein